MQKDYYQIVNTIKNQTSVLDILSYYGINYVKRKNEYVIKCIFHEQLLGRVDKKPSLSINEDKRVYNCWSCPAKGNIIQFVQQCEKYYNDNECSFNNAVKIICDIMGFDYGSFFADDIDVPDVDVEIEEITFDDITEQEVFQESALNKFYLKYHKYFENRGFKPETLKYFEMGFGVKGSDVDRCIFPIRNASKQLIGWTGRTVHPDGNPKWLHQPSGRFKKELALFNIDRAFREIYQTRKVYVVESVGNNMRFYEAGYENCVAILGSKMSDYQARLLSVYASEIYLCFDNDFSGIEGTKIAIEKLSQYNVRIFVAQYDFGQVDGKSRDFADVSSDEINKVKYVLSNDWLGVDNMEKLLDVEFSKKGTPVELSNGVIFLCVDKLRLTQKLFIKNHYADREVYRITEEEGSIIKKMDRLFSLNDFILEESPF